MKTRILRAACAALATFALLAAGSAEAVFRSYLASNGVDTDPCTLQQPCRLLPAALAAVDPGGEIWILDSANYNTGTVTINKSVTILAIPGAVGSIVGNGGDGLLINTAGVRVTLRNLVFVNITGNNNGVLMTAGTSLTIRDSTFMGMTNAGVYVTSIGTKAQIVNSTFDRNSVGVRVFAGIVTLHGNHFMNHTIAIEAAGAGTTGASNSGAYPPNGTTRVYVQGGSILDNGTAFHMDSPGVRINSEGSCNAHNIFLYNSNGGFSIHMHGNTTNFNVTGPYDANVGCTFPSGFDIGQYNSNPYQNNP